MSKYKKIWLDPVWSKVISALIILLMTLIYSFIKSMFSDKAFLTAFKDFWTLKIDIWILAVAVILTIFIFLAFRKKIKINPLLTSKHFTKYFGVYEVYHFAPHTTGNPKLTKSYLLIDPIKTQYVHSLFECEDGEIEQIDGHIFLNLKNREQKNAPYYFILKSVNDAKIDYLGGACLGIGQNQNCHPIAVKVALKRRDDITDFSIEKYKTYCTIEDFPREKAEQEPYKKLVTEFLWNKCWDKDILF